MGAATARASADDEAARRQRECGGCQRTCAAPRRRWRGLRFHTAFWCKCSCCGCILAGTRCRWRVSNAIPRRAFAARFEGRLPSARVSAQARDRGSSSAWNDVCTCTYALCARYPCRGVTDSALRRHILRCARCAACHLLAVLTALQIRGGAFQPSQPRLLVSYHVPSLSISPSLPVLVAKAAFP